MMGLETLPAFTAQPSKADGEQVSESRGPWSHPQLAQSERKPQQLCQCQVICRALAAVSDSARTAWLVATHSLRQLLVGHRCLWEESTRSSTQPEVSPDTQSST